MERTNKRIGEITDVGQLFVTVVHQKYAGEDAQHEQPEVGEERTGEESPKHGNKSLLKKLKSSWPALWPREAVRSEDKHIYSLRMLSQAVKSYSTMKFANGCLT